MRPVRCKVSLQSLGFYDTLIIFVYNNNNNNNNPPLPVVAVAFFVIPSLDKKLPTYLLKYCYIFVMFDVDLVLRAKVDDRMKHFCFILSTGTKIRIMMRPRSSSRGCNTNTSVTVTVTEHRACAGLGHSLSCIYFVLLNLCLSVLTLLMMAVPA